MTHLLEQTYGPDARNRLADAGEPSIDGARAVLESFYYAFNQCDADVFARVWVDDPLVQLNNPLGGVLRGIDAIAALYARVFDGPVRVTVTFQDVVEYAGPGYAVFAGREIGAYEHADGGGAVPLATRTSRFLAWNEVASRWGQLHHHGSIDDAQALADYQRAVRGS